jgi:hypothetical protein
MAHLRVSLLQLRPAWLVPSHGAAPRTPSLAPLFVPFGTWPMASPTLRTCPLSCSERFRRTLSGGKKPCSRAHTSRHSTPTDGHCLTITSSPRMLPNAATALTYYATTASSAASGSPLRRPTSPRLTGKRWQYSWRCSGGVRRAGSPPYRPSPDHHHRRVAAVAAAAAPQRLPSFPNHPHTRPPAHHHHSSFSPTPLQR